MSFIKTYGRCYQRFTQPNNQENSPSPITQNPEYIEIGGIKWATKNVGANNITDIGLYFQWGDIQGYTVSQIGNGEEQKAFIQDDYKYTDDDSTFIKYNGTDGLTTLQLSDDAVAANWGGNWRMPTSAEFAVLGNACKFIDSSGTEITGNNRLTTLNGVTGIYIQDKEDSSKKLFFPAAGFASDGSVEGVNDYGNYWSSSLDSEDVEYACQLFFDDRFLFWEDNGDDRCNGYPVRGILDE